MYNYKARSPCAWRLMLYLLRKTYLKDKLWTSLQGVLSLNTKTTSDQSGNILFYDSISVLTVVINFWILLTGIFGFVGAKRNSFCFLTCYMPLIAILFLVNLISLGIAYVDLDFLLTHFFEFIQTLYGFPVFDRAVQHLISENNLLIL